MIHAEYVAPLVLHLLSWVSESEVRPIEVRFGHGARTDPSEYSRVSRGPVKFGASRSEIVVRGGVLDRPSVRANSRFAELHVTLA